MHPQLDLVADEYRSAQARLHELVRAVPEERWGRRADPARWSVAECVAHLNLTSMAYLPLFSMPCRALACWSDGHRVGTVGIPSAGCCGRPWDRRFGSA